MLLVGNNTLDKQTRSCACTSLPRREQFDPRMSREPSCLQPGPRGSAGGDEPQRRDAAGTGQRLANARCSALARARAALGKSPIPLPALRSGGCCCAAQSCLLPSSAAVRLLESVGKTHPSSKHRATLRGLYFTPRSPFLGVFPRSGPDLLAVRVPARQSRCHARCRSPGFPTPASCCQQALHDLSFQRPRKQEHSHFKLQIFQPNSPFALSLYYHLTLLCN